MLPDRVVVFVAPAVIAFEAVLAAALLVPQYAVMAAATCAALLTVYSSAIALNLARGRRDLDCGCLGPAGRQPISGWLLVRNSLFIAGSLAATMPSTGRSLLLVDAISIAGALAVLALLSATLDALIVALSRVYPEGRRP